jgi:hypothetical protein
MSAEERFLVRQLNAATDALEPVLHEMIVDIALDLGQQLFGPCFPLALAAAAGASTELDYYRPVRGLANPQEPA